MTKNRTKSIENINGNDALAIASLETFPMELATKRFTPSGGERNPMARFTTMIAPKWTGSMPICTTRGIRIGESKTIAAMVSINIPTSSRKTFMVSISTSGLSERLLSALAICMGMPTIVMTWQKKIAMAMINMIGIIVWEPSARTLGSCCKENSL